MNHIDEPLGCFVDRAKEDSKLESIDVVMLTLDAENFLEKSLYTVFREIPVNRLIVCDGGSKDKTLEILKTLKREEMWVREPDNIPVPDPRPIMLLSALELLIENQQKDRIV